MFLSKKSKLMWHKIKNKKKLVLHLDNIYKLTYLTPKGLRVFLLKTASKQPLLKTSQIVQDWN
jgi:hypothetical protein